MKWRNSWRAYCGQYITYSRYRYCRQTTTRYKSAQVLVLEILHFDNENWLSLFYAFNPCKQKKMTTSRFNSSFTLNYTRNPFDSTGIGGKADEDVEDHAFWKPCAQKDRYNAAFALRKESGRKSGLHAHCRPFLASMFTTSLSEIKYVRVHGYQVIFTSWFLGYNILRIGLE